MIYFDHLNNSIRTNHEALSSFQTQIKTMATNANKIPAQNTAKDIFLNTAQILDKYPALKYAANNARILSEPVKYYALSTICPKLAAPDEREKEPATSVAWPEMGEQLDREIYYNKETNEVEDEDYEVIGMRMEPDKEHSDYWIKFN